MVRRGPGILADYPVANGWFLQKNGFASEHSREKWGSRLCAVVPAIFPG